MDYVKDGGTSQSPRMGIFDGWCHAALGRSFILQSGGCYDSRESWRTWGMAGLRTEPTAAYVSSHSHANRTPAATNCAPCEEDVYIFCFSGWCAEDNNGLRNMLLGELRWALLFNPYRSLLLLAVKAQLYTTAHTQDRERRSNQHHIVHKQRMFMMFCPIYCRFTIFPRSPYSYCPCFPMAYDTLLWRPDEVKALLLTCPSLTACLRCVGLLDRLECRRVQGDV